MAVASFLSVGSTLYGFGLFTLPVSKEFGLTRSQFNTGITIVHIADALVSPIVGRLADRYSLRILVISGGLCLGAGLIALGLSTSLTLDLFILAIVVPFGFIATTSIPAYTLITRWFDARRGRAMAIFAIGASLSGIVGVPAIGYLIEMAGWRNTLLIMGSALAVLIFLFGMLIVNRPRDGEHDHPARRPLDGAPTERAEDRVWTARQLILSPRLWQYAGAVSLILGAATSILLSLVPYGQQLGMDTVLATTLISALSMSSIVAKLGLVFIADRMDRVLLFSIASLLLTSLCVVLLIKPGYPLLLAGCLLAGCSLGVSFPLFAAIMADTFGTRSYGTALGMAAPLLAVANAGGANFVGLVHDRTGSYDIAFAVYAATSITAALLVLIARPKRSKGDGKDVSAPNRPAAATS